MTQTKFYRRYPESFKLSVISEYLNTDYSDSYLCNKHDLPRGLIRRWMRRLGVAVPDSKLPYLALNNLPPLAPKNPPAVLLPDSHAERRIRELERQLEDEQLRSEAYLRMIDIAEKEYKIPIRKKPATR